MLENEAIIPHLLQPRKCFGLGISRPFFELIADYVALKKGKHILTLRLNVLEKRFPSKFKSLL